jgi:hypothetical protein
LIRRYFGVEFAVALSIGSVSLFADSVDFLGDASVNFLILMALGWSVRSRARALLCGGANEMAIGAVEHGVGVRRPRAIGCQCGEAGVAAPASRAPHRGDDGIDAKRSRPSIGRTRDG